MIYTQGKGITALGPELKALLAFADPDGRIDIVVHNGKMTAHASVGGNSVFHIVEGWNGGKPVTDDLAWQIDTRSIARQSKSCGTNEEVFFPVSTAGRISRARIRRVDDDEGVLQDSSLDNHVTHQNVIPIMLAPEEVGERGTAPSLWLPAGAVFARLKTVAAATSAAIARYCIPDDDSLRTRIEFDTTKRFRDNESARWIVMLAASSPSAEREDSAKPAVDNRQEKLFDEDESDGLEEHDVPDDEPAPASRARKKGSKGKAKAKGKPEKKSKIVPKPVKGKQGKTTKGRKVSAEAAE